MQKILQNLIRSRSGAAAIEYALVSTGVAIVLTLGSMALVGNLDGVFNSMAPSLVDRGYADEGSAPVDPTTIGDGSDTGVSPPVMPPQPTFTAMD